MNKWVVKNDDEHVNENESNIENSEHLFDFRFQFKNERFSMNRKKTDRLKMSEKNKKRSWQFDENEFIIRTLNWSVYWHSIHIENCRNQTHYRFKIIKKDCFCYHELNQCNDIILNTLILQVAHIDEMSVHKDFHLKKNYW